MLALIIFMGFSLVSAMGLYWFVGAIFSIVQTLVIQVYNDRKAARK
jgi:membrane protein insertase Oxa1/YidC/SpoIIIJ